MIAGGALLVALLLPSAIGAAAVTPGVETKLRLEVHAPADCTSRSDLAVRVSARSPRIQIVDEAAVSADVTVALPRPGHVVAELVLATAGADPTPRRFVARSCAEAADAVALSIAVTLDPTAARKSAVVPEPDPNAAEAPGANPAAPPAPPPKPPEPVEKPLPPAVIEAPAPPPADAAGAASRRFGAHAAGQAIFGPAPDVMPGIAIYGVAALDRAGVWSPAVFVGATRVWSGDVAAAGGAAAFTLDAATVDACPLRLRWSWLESHPCASLLLGRLTARGAGDTEQPASVSRPFAVAGLALTAAAGAPVEVTARIGAGLTLVRDSYEIGTTTFHRAARFTAAASLGVGFRWP